jgi:iron-sulfur cluster assembly protein
MAVNVTEEAALELKRAHSEGNLDPDTFVRVGVLAGGCAGFEYSLSFDDKFDEQKDSRYDQHGVAVVVDKKSGVLLDGAVIGYHKCIEGQGFTFENPNATKSCGCGKSFQ